MTVQATEQAGLPQVDAPLVVQVVRQYAPGRGGLEDVVANLAKALPGLGFRVRVVTCDRLFTAPDVTLPPYEVIDGVEVRRIPWTGSKRYPLAPAVFGALRDADLVHVHAVDFFFDALAIGRMIHGKPMIATTHGGFFHTQTHSTLKKIWFRTVTRASASQYARLACCSQSDLAMFSTIAARRAVLVENGVDALKFAGDRPAEPQKRLVTIGRFSDNKRLDRLLDSVKALAARDPDWRLDIIGSGSDLSADDLAQMISARGLTGKVSIHIGVTDKAITSLLSNASLFVSASEYEGFGLVAVEAMGAGLVPVLHANDAYRALAGRHPGIVLADFSDPVASAMSIEVAFQSLCANPVHLVDAMREAASAYSWEKVSRRYADLYREALGQP